MCEPVRNQAQLPRKGKPADSQDHTHIRRAIAARAPPRDDYPKALAAGMQNARVFNATSFDFKRRDADFVISGQMLHPAAPQGRVAILGSCRGRTKRVRECGAMAEYVHPAWRDLLARNDLRGFDDFWNRPGEWFEPPNHRRGGWSGVAVLDLVRADGAHVRIFVKRQENHVARTWRHPLRGLPTLAREFENFRRFERGAVPGATLVYFGRSRAGGTRRAVLATEELAGFRSLESWMRRWDAEGWPPPAERRALVDAMATAVRRMHAAGLRHNSLWPKHLFVRPPSGGAPLDVRIIDLEQMRPAWSRHLAARKDLGTLHRHCPGFEITDRARFLRTYLGIRRLADGRGLWRAVERESRRKARRARGAREESGRRRREGTAP